MSTTSNTESPDIILKIWIMLAQAHDALHRYRQRELRKLSLTVAEVGTLSMIESLGGEATPTELSLWLFRKAHSVSRQLHRMEKKDLIVISKDLDHKNLVKVTLSDKGRAAYEASKDMSTVYKVLSSLPEENQQRLLSDLGAIRDKSIKGMRIKLRPPHPSFK
jgi:DNA-binding MarR family transcriptional regulator